MRRLIVRIGLLVLSGIALALALLGTVTMFRTCVVAIQSNYALEGFLSDWIPPFVRYAGDILRSMFPWPAIVLFGLFIFFRSPSAITGLIGLMRIFRRVSVLGAEIVVSEETKSQLQNASAELNAAIQEYSDDTTRKISLQVRQFGIERRLGDLVEKKFKPQLKGKKLPENFRCTVHVPDVVINGHLYQLLDYYPHGGGGGRRLSERYGIIGKVWRSEKARSVGFLFEGHGSLIEKFDSEEYLIERMMEEWGMNRREAISALSKPSYICCPIVHEDKMIGLVYMDSSEKNAFQLEESGKEIEDLVREVFHSNLFPKSLSDLASELDKSYIGLDVS